MVSMRCAQLSPPARARCLSGDCRTLPCLLALGVSSTEGTVTVWVKGVSEEVEGHILGGGRQVAFTCFS